MDTPESEKALIATFHQRAVMPGWLRSAIEKAEANRRYLHTDAFHEDDPYAVAINFLYRKGRQKLAMIWPKDAEPMCKPASQVEPEGPDQAVNAMEVQIRQRVSDTASVALRHLGRAGDLLGALRSAAEDCMPAGIAWIKVGWQEDSTRDFLGNRRGDDQQDQLALLRELGREFAAGEWGQDDARYQQLQDLNAYARQAMMRVMASGDLRAPWVNQAMQTPPGSIMPWWIIPEPEQWRGATYDFIKMENLRLDWARVVSPRHHRLGRWEMERVWMTRTEIAAEWGLDEEERRQLGARLSHDQESVTTLRGSTGEAQEPGTEGLEDSTRGPDEVAVWEVWDRETEHRYVYADGMDRFLEKEPITLRTRLRSCYLPVYFNPAAGRFAPISDVTLGRKLQEEITQALTDQSEGRQARLPKYLVDGMVVDEDDALELERARPHKVVRTKKRVEDVEKAIKVIEGARIDPAAYNVSAEMSGLNEMVGVPGEANGGATKPEFAEQIKVIGQSMNVAAEDMATMLIEVMRDAFTITLDYLATMADEAWIKKIAGPYAAWPLFDREAVLRGLLVEVVASSSPMARQNEIEGVNLVTDSLLKLFTLKQTANALGYDVDIEPLAGKAMKAADLRMPVGRFLTRLAPPMGMPAMMPPGVGPGPAGMLPGGMPPVAPGMPAGLPPPALPMRR